MKSVIEVFENLEDTRDNRGKKHKLIDIIVMSIYAIICGNTDSENIADWFHLRKDYFTQLLHLENGIPSADTFLRVFAGINPEKFMSLFVEWISSVVSSSNKVIAIDGKAVKSAAEKGNIPYIVSAYLIDIGLSFCQVKTDSKSNEITAIPELIEILDIKDSIISIDAIGTQKNIVSKIVQKEGHYCLNLKENHKTMYQEVKEYFDYALTDKKEIKNMLQFQTKSFGHGRIETRNYYVVKDIDFITNKKEWKNLKNVCLVTNQREMNGNVSIQHKYYITDLDITSRKTCTNHKGTLANRKQSALDIRYSF